MTDTPALPDRFRAFVVERAADGTSVDRHVREVSAVELPPGEIVVRVGWSDVNYKDGLATTADGKVARISPLIPGIDMAGEVVESAVATIPVGSQVIAHGYDLGTSRHGGYTEYERVPGDWVVPLPLGMTPREAMAIGTAGFTAAMSVAALQARGLTPDDGPVLVTGASGGVGRMAVAMLARNAFEVWAATGKADEADRLRAIGATDVVDRSIYSAGAGKAFERERWAAAVDTVGAATLPYVLRSLKYNGAVAATGNTSGGALDTTVFPFILRGVSLIGIDSAHLDIRRRREIWERLAHDLRPIGLEDAISEVTLETLEPALDAILAGQARGRWVVRIGG